MSNKCLKCNNYINVKFDFGQEIKFCSRLKIYLTNSVLSCTEFSDNTPLKRVMEDWQLMEFVQSFKPYIIEDKLKTGFNTEKDIIIRPATPKDKKDDYSE